MQASELWAGHDYAFAIYGKPRGQRFTTVRRVKLISVSKEKSLGERAKTYAMVQYLDKDGNVQADTPQRKVRARDIVNFWDDYQAEYNAYLEQERIRRQERERIANERKAQQAEKRRKAEARAFAIKNALANRGIEPEAVTINTTYYGELYDHVTIKTEVLESWLGLDVS